MAKGLKRRSGPGEDLEPEPGVARIAWWRARLRAALKRGEVLQVPRHNLAAVMALHEVTREIVTKGKRR